MSTYKSSASRRQVARQRRRRKENRRFAQILKVFMYHKRTGQWLHHSLLEWHHPNGRQSHGECVAQCYRNSRERLLEEIRRCVVMTIWEHDQHHRERFASKSFGSSHEKIKTRITNIQQSASP
jgi:hypothetical protein